MMIHFSTKQKSLFRREMKKSSIINLKKKSWSIEINFSLSINVED